ncbi:hypothetical protein [Flavobacterium sp. CS20]
MYLLYSRNIFTFFGAMFCIFKGIMTIVKSLFE